MNERNQPNDPGKRRGATKVLIGTIIICSGLGSRATSDEPKMAGSCASEAGTMMARPSADSAWHAVKAGERLPAGDLLVGFPGAAIDSENGAIHLTMLGDLDRNSPYPVIENAVVLHSGDGTDLSFTLDRGRVDVINRKKSGPAQVKVKVRDTSLELSLLEPGTRVAFETYGRWPRGVRFSKEPDPKNAPTTSLIILVLKGDVHVKHGGFETTMRAPPGPAMLEWDSVTGADESPVHLDKLPAWAQANGEDSPEAKQKKAVIEKFRQALLAKGQEAALEEFLASDDKMDRALAVFVLGALDDLPRLGKALREAKHFDVWDNGVVALRHWIGRGPGKDQILYKRLIENANFKPRQAEAVLQLLHSFGEEDLARPETYQALIDFMDHDLLAIRGLAYWHLYRLVPAGRELGYDPLGTKEERDEAINKWRKLVPPGTVPSRTASEPKK
jgi:hypothetical protein